MKELPEHLVVVPDIFGITEDFAALVNKISLPEFNTITLDPYPNYNTNFYCEKAAFLFFQKNCGLDYYSNQLYDKIDNLVGNVFLIGFSVGASAIWNVSKNNYGGRIKQAVCFYGSQIRNEINLNPTFNTTLIFPDSEVHFSVKKLIDQLKEKEKVSIVKEQHLHGFMNQRSKNFELEAYQKYLKYLQEQLTLL